MTPWTVTCQALLSMGFPRTAFQLELPRVAFQGTVHLVSLQTKTGLECSKNAGVGSHSPLQGIFPTQELKLDLLHCRCLLYCQSHQESLMVHSAPQGSHPFAHFLCPARSWYYILLESHSTLLALSVGVSEAAAVQTQPRPAGSSRGLH